MIYYNYSKGGEQKLNITDIIKKPIGALTLTDVYQLASVGYIFIKKNNQLIIGRVK